MATPLDAPMPANLDLGPGFTLRVTALAVADGSVVSAVNVSNLSVLAQDVAGDGGASLQTGPWYLVPGPGTDTSTLEPSASGTVAGDLGGHAT